MKENLKKVAQKEVKIYLKKLKILNKIFSPKMIQFRTNYCFQDKDHKN